MKPVHISTHIPAPQDSANGPQIWVSGAAVLATPQWVLYEGLNVHRVYF
jgi:hypothetical protein